MLKALEIIGFKSFADKTRFEFPAGITAIVGPNGSGKSNVVDAIKWVLGEQSVKSLRGREMVDCIFNGSGERSPLHAAECTLLFDNTKRIFDIDSDEVQITRRVYRSGEGEYLINRQASRLKDIRELLAGTGATTEAYCVIEQGKVDLLLQSSAKDRRAIFEEAAGVSRFKAKKVESQRRLERVEQNLLRLSDIVEEVEHRLKTIRLQAAKARRYREYSARLQELRTQVARADWRLLTENLTVLDTEIARLKSSRDEITGAIQSVEVDLQHRETELGAIESAVFEVETTRADVRQRIGVQESTVDHESLRERDAENDAARRRRQLTTMNIRAGDVRVQFETTRLDVAAAESKRNETARRAADARGELAEFTRSVSDLRANFERRRGEHLASLSRHAALDKEISAVDLQSAALAAQRGALKLQIVDHRRENDALTAESEDLQSNLTDTERRLEAVKAESIKARTQHTACRQRLQEASQALQELRLRQKGLSERVTVLIELERRSDGLNASVKDVLERMRAADSDQWRHVRGVLADLLHGDVATGPLVEIALGEKAQHLVVGQDDELFAFLARESHRLPGRVGFVRVESSDLADESAEDGPNFRKRPGVVGRADDFVETAPEHRGLARRLLRNTWIVERLSHALAINEPERAGQSFVTLGGEHLSADRSLSVGPKHAMPVLISRKAELRALQSELESLSGEIEEGSHLAETLTQSVAESEEHNNQLAARKDAANRQRSEAAMAVANAQNRLAALTALRARLDSEYAATERNEVDAFARRAAIAQQFDTIAKAVVEHQVALEQLNSTREEFENSRRLAETKSADVEVELGKCDERLSHLTDRLHQLESDQNERARALNDLRSQIVEQRSRASVSRFAVLAAESALAELYLSSEHFAREAANLRQSQDGLREKRALLTSRLKSLQAEAQQLDNRIHAQELAANEIRHERSSLAARLLEDYGIELKLEETATDAEQREREAVEIEIAELRRKINNIGSVNLEALDELEGLETRFNSLSSQYNDLRQAKDSLEQIITRINQDSRRLFTETLEAVRGNFQTLFRKLFGGGHADIVLEEGVDPLESGVEIIARPPGKEPRSISLLSGGEKTLTCVAMLLAIFQYRPSPFCVLDEVDAALDEANIERFVSVLQEFLEWTQFVVVTHSKKTMTCATTLYGVTMQESGISKRVSVQFDNVSDSGEILLREPAAAESAGQDETQAA